MCTNERPYILDIEDVSPVERPRSLVVEDIVIVGGVRGEAGEEVIGYNITGSQSRHGRDSLQCI